MVELDRAVGIVIGDFALERDPASAPAADGHEPGTPGQLI
jgi:hypothetical protein